MFLVLLQSLFIFLSSEKSGKYSGVFEMLYVPEGSGLWKQLPVITAPHETRLSFAINLTHVWTSCKVISNSYIQFFYTTGNFCVTANALLIDALIFFFKG